MYIIYALNLKNMLKCIGTGTYHTNGKNGALGGTRLITFSRLIAWAATLTTVGLFELFVSLQNLFGILQAPTPTMTESCPTMTISQILFVILRKCESHNCILWKKLLIVAEKRYLGWKCCLYI